MNSLNTTNEMQCIPMLAHEFEELPQWVRLAYMLLLCCIFLAGVSGNLITCIVIYCDKTMHTATNYYLFNLAVSDLIVSFGLLLDLNAYSGYPFKLGSGDASCRAHFFLVGALWNNGILIMTALAIERYIAVWHPLLLSRRTVWRRVMKVIYLIWTVAILETLPEMWTMRLYQTKSTGICIVIPTTYARLVNGILGLMNFVIPLVVMTFVYSMVAFKVNVMQKGCLTDKIFNHRNNSSRVNKLVTLTLSFVICWLPFFSLRILLFTGVWCHTPWFLEYWDVVVMLGSVNGWFSIVINPLLFSLMSTKFRKALKTLWNTKVRTQKSTLRPQHC